MAKKILDKKGRVIGQFKETEYKRITEAEKSAIYKETQDWCRKNKGKPFFTTKERLFLDQVKIDEKNNIHSKDTWLDKHFYDNERWHENTTTNPEYWKEVFREQVRAKVDYIATKDHLFDNDRDFEPLQPVMYENDRMTWEDRFKFWVGVLVIVFGLWLYMYSVKLFIGIIICFLSAVLVSASTKK